MDNRRRKSVSEISTCPDQGTKNREHFKIELPFYSFSNQFKFGFVYWNVLNIGIETMPLDLHGKIYSFVSLFEKN